MSNLNHTSGPKLPGTAADGGGADTVWANPNNAKLVDGSNATNSWGGGGLRSNDLKLTNFGFAIPSNAIIDGIVLEMNRSGSSALDLGINLVKAGSSVGTNKAANGYPASLAWATYGGEDDLWGTTWTPAEVNASNFGAAISAINSSGGGIASVDAAQLTVYWHYDFSVAPADVPVRHDYKVYNNAGDFMGMLKKVVSEFTFSEEVNSIGSSIKVEVGVSPDTSHLPNEPILTEAGDPILTEDNEPLMTEAAPPVMALGDSDDAVTLIKNGNRIVVIESNYYYPNGKEMFAGQINRIEGGFGDQFSDTLSLLVLSDSLDLDQYPARGTPFTYTQDITQLFGASYFTVDGLAGGWNRAGQSFALGAGVTNCAAVSLRLNGSANVTINLYTAPGGDIIDSITQKVEAPGQTDVQFAFPSINEGDGSGNFFFTIGVGTGESIQVYYNSGNLYAGGAMYTANYSGGSGGGAFGVSAGNDLYFVTYSGVTATAATYSLTDPTTEMLAPVIDDYNLRGGRVTYQPGEIEATGLHLTYQINTNTILEVIKAAKDMAPSDFYCRVDLGSLEIEFKRASETADFIFTKGREINGLKLGFSIENVKNSGLFTGGDLGAGVNLYREYSRPASRARYGVRLDRKSDGRVKFEDTADAIGESYLDEKQGEESQTTVTILSKHRDITLLTPGKMIGFAGFGSFVDSLVVQIVRREYTSESVVLDLGALPPRQDITIEKLTREVLAQQTVANPSTPT